MPAPQPGPVINVLLLTLFGVGGYFAGTLTKPAAKRSTEVADQKSIVAATTGAGDFAADVRRYTAAATAGAADLESLFPAYGTGSRELTLLAGLVMEKWAAADAAAALRTGVPRCAAYAPDMLPRAFAAIAAQKSVPPADVFKALPAPPMRGECAAAAARAWGAAGNADALALSQDLSRRDRTRFVKEWHYAAPDTAAAVTADADDRSAAALGRLLGLAEKDPAAALREGRTHEDFADIAAAAFTAWVPRNSPAAWQAAEAFANHPRLAVMTSALVIAESKRRPLSEALAELQTLIGRLHPGGPPEEVLRVLIPALAAERPQLALKYVDGLPEGTPLRQAATVVLFDVFSDTDPAAAWRLSDTLLQQQGVKDSRLLQPWADAPAHRAASALSRWQAGFPCMADVAVLLANWMQRDPSAALSNFIRAGVPEPLQTAALEAALHPRGGAFSSETLYRWLATQPLAVRTNLEATAAKLTGAARPAPAETAPPKNGLLLPR